MIASNVALEVDGDNPMGGNVVHILDASSLINVRQIAAAANDPRFFDALIPPGRLVITSTVWEEAAGNPLYLGDRLLHAWLTAQQASGRLERSDTPNFPAGPLNSGDDTLHTSW